MMKICFVTKTIFNIGGIQRVVSVLANELSRHHEVYIICTLDNFPEDRTIYNLDKRVKVKINNDLIKKNNFIKFATNAGKVINKYTKILNNNRFVGLLEKIYYPKEMKKRFIKFLNNEHYDVVIGVDGAYALLIASISKSLNAKTMGWQHNCYEAYLKSKHEYYWNQELLFLKLIKELDRYMVLTEHDKMMFKKEMDINCDVIYNPKSFISKEKSEVDTKIFLAAGRLTEQKGFDLLIESFKVFAEEENEWKLIILGDGKDKNKLANLISKYELGNRIKIEPFTNNIKKYFLNSSVLVLSSRWEGMPMIVLESFEMGVPVIAYNISAAEQLIKDGKEGVLVEKFNVEKFAMAMKEVSQSYDLRKTMSNNALKKSKQFDVENISKQWNIILEEICRN